jgi:hypothetical protein
VAALTGATAVVASWVTSRGNARAAKVQAEASAQADRGSRSWELKRSAYREFIEQAHVTGELYFRLGDVYAQVSDPGNQLRGIEQLRADLRDAFDPLMRSARIVVMEGPDSAADAAEAVRRAAAETNGALWLVSQGEEGARERFDEAQRRFRTELDRFIAAARTSMDAGS